MFQFASSPGGRPGPIEIIDQQEKGQASWPVTSKGGRYAEKGGMGKKGDPPFRTGEKNGKHKSVKMKLK